MENIELCLYEREKNIFTLYDAPELLENNENAFSVASDIWSLGCLLYEVFWEK